MLMLLPPYASRLILPLLFFALIAAAITPCYAGHAIITIFDMIRQPLRCFDADSQMLLILIRFRHVDYAFSSLLRHYCFHLLADAAIIAITR